MPRNIEIKARAPDWHRQLAAARDLAQSTFELHQEDTFFDCASGLLKLRDFGDGPGELIHYQRQRGGGPRLSRYSICPVTHVAALREMLGTALGVRAVVRKRRLVLLVGQTRIHFDDVEGLGRFIELEVVLRDDQSEDDGRAIARDLAARLQITPGNEIIATYAELLAGRTLAAPCAANPQE